MNVYSIGGIGGNGIGLEVLRKGVRALEHIAALDGSFRFDFTYFRGAVNTTFNMAP